MRLYSKSYTQIKLLVECSSIKQFKGLSHNNLPVSQTRSIMEKSWQTHASKYLWVPYCLCGAIEATQPTIAITALHLTTSQ